MAHTGFTAATERGGDRAYGHQFAEGDLSVVQFEDIPRATHPADGLISNVEDMLTFLQAHASIELSPLDSGAVTFMQRPRISGGSIGPVVVDHIGTGWMLLEIGDELVLVSQGGDLELISAMVVVPTRQFGMVVLTNSESALLLANDAVLRGLSAFIGLSLPEPTTYELPRDEAINGEGRFGLPGWLTFTTSAAGGQLLLETSAGGKLIPDFTGQVFMTSTTLGYLPYLGGRIWLDFVPYDTGTIRWLRFAARLAPRIE